MGYISNNRHKFYLKCHLIFVCKYRKQLLLSEIRECVLSVFKEVESKYDFDIEIMETDKDHIHLLQLSLRKHFWQEHGFWPDGYFVCSIGEANTDTIRKYIENQG